MDLKKNKFTIRNNERKYIPRRKYPKPMRYVGMGLILMIVILFFMYRFMVKVK